MELKGEEMEEVDELKGPDIPQNPKRAYLLALLDSIVFGVGNHYAAALARRKNGALGLFCQWPTLLFTSACFHLYKFIQLKREDKSAAFFNRKQSMYYSSKNNKISVITSEIEVTAIAE